MSDETIVKATREENLPAKFAELSDELTDRIQVAIDRISETNYVPTRDRPWAGRLDVLQHIQDEGGCSLAEAEKVLELAVEQLLSTTREDVAMVERRKLIHRLNGYRQIALQAVQEPKEVEVWKFKVRTKNGQPLLDEKGKIQATAIPVRRTRTKGIDTAALRLLIELEDRIYQAHRLDSAGSESDMTISSFEQFDRDADGRATSNVVVSISQKHAAKGLQQLPPRARKIVEQAIAEQMQRKQVVSVVKGEEDETEEVREPDSVPDGAQEGDEVGGLGPPALP